MDSQYAACVTLDTPTKGYSILLTTAHRSEADFLSGPRHKYTPPSASRPIPLPHPEPPRRVTLLLAKPLKHPHHILHICASCRLHRRMHSKLCQSNIHCRHRHLPCRNIAQCRASGDIRTIIPHSPSYLRFFIHSVAHRLFLHIFRQIKSSDLPTWLARLV